MKKMLRKKKTQGLTVRIGDACRKIGRRVGVWARKWLRALRLVFKKLFSLVGVQIRDKVVQPVADKVVQPVAAPYRKLPPFLRYAVLGSAGLLVVAVLLLIVTSSVRSAKAKDALGVTEVAPELDLTAADPIGAATPAPDADDAYVATTAVPADYSADGVPTDVPDDGADSDASDDSEPTDAPDESWTGDYLEKGDSDARIADVQTRLMELGYMDSDEPTEYFGSHTFAALKVFQRHNALDADGVIGGATYTTLLSSDAKEYVMQQGDYGDDVTYMQERLYELGYLAKDFITGNFVEKTSEAVLAFQEANGLHADGKVGEKTLEKLYSEDVVANFFEKGDTSETIAKYQKRLKELDYLDNDYKATGTLDSETVRAIKRFQTVNGLSRDGYLGPTTMEMLDSSAAEKYALSLGMNGTDVKEAQLRLYKLKYLTKSKATGYYGESTVDAVKAFQRRNGLRVDGAIGANTKEALFSSSAKEAAATPKPTAKPTATPKATATPKVAGSKATPTPKATATPKPDSGGSSDESTSSSSGVEKFIEVAKSKLGKPYVRGAKGPNAFDCSGFVYWCLNQAGVKQGYMTSITWRTCSNYTRIKSMSDIKRGDVLVFSGSTSAKGHVGIYLGSGKMIDAGNSDGKVRISSTVLSGSYWKSHFLMAYRIWD